MGKGEEKAFEELKKKISQAPILALPKFQQTFKVDRDVSGYVMRVVLMQGGRLVCYHPEVFHGEVLNYPTYYRELYALVQVVKNWKNYLMGKETLLHKNH